MVFDKPNEESKTNSSKAVFFKLLVPRKLIDVYIMAQKPLCLCFGSQDELQKERT